MQYRCTNAFTFNGRTVAGGALVDGDDPIIKSHAAHFVAVVETVRAVETASADKPRTAEKVEVVEQPTKPARRTSAKSKPASE